MDTKFVTVTLQNNLSGKRNFSGQDILTNRRIVGVYENINNQISSGPRYTGSFELTIISNSNNILAEKIPNISLRRDATALNYIPIKFDNISLDNSFIHFLTINTNFVQLIFEYYD